MSYKVAIFDMDGTILDTTADLCDAVNYAMEKTGHKHDFTNDEAKHLFGSGVVVAIKRALLLENGFALEALEAVGTEKEVLPSSITKEEVERIQKIYQPYYAKNCAVKTGPYPGIIELIKMLREHGVKTAVVSNKPDEAVQPLVVEYFDGMFDLSVGVTPDIRRKPYPDVTLKSVKEMNVTVADCVYIGDSEIDLQTAENAGMDCISVDWGFRNQTFLKAHGAKCVVANARDIYNIICGK